MANERKYYDLVADLFLSKELGCFDYKKEIGTTMGKVDVVGIKELSSDYKSNTELVSVEVKDENARFLNSIGQAFAYSVYTHRCYLAFNKSSKNKFKQEEIDIANQFGVGLIEIRNRKEIKVISLSRQFEPKPHYVYYFKSKLGYFNCVICDGAYKEQDIAKINQPGPISIKDDETYLGNLDKAIKQRRNALYYLYGLSQQRRDERSYVYDKRYICKDCLSIFSPLVNMA